MEINERRLERWESRRRKQRGRKEKRRGRKEKRRGKKGRKEEERRERGREKEKGENGTRGALPSTDAFPSTKLGNNITPMKGRLGKNTTPTSRSPMELNQNFQNNPTSTLHPAPTLVAPSEVSKCELYSKGATIYKKAETLGNHYKRLNFHQH